MRLQYYNSKMYSKLFLWRKLTMDKYSISRLMFQVTTLFTLNFSKSI